MHRHYMSNCFLAKSNLDYVFSRCFGNVTSKNVKVTFFDFNKPQKRIIELWILLRSGVRDPVTTARVRGCKERRYGRAETLFVVFCSLFYLAY